MFRDEDLGAWDEAYGTWLEHARPFLEQAQWKEAFAAGYPWVKPVETPFAPLARPLSQARLGIVSTAGFYVTGSQERFQAEEIEGDTSYRVLADSVTPADLSIAHTHYPHASVLADWNTVLPLDHLRAMVASGQVGSLGPIFSVSGYCTDAAKLLRTSAVAIAREARQSGCDAVLLVPV